MVPLFNKIRLQRITNLIIESNSDRHKLLAASLVCVQREGVRVNGSHDTQRCQERERMRGVFISWLLLFGLSAHFALALYASAEKSASFSDLLP
jgi:hypothetical protein